MLDAGLAVCEGGQAGFATAHAVFEKARQLLTRLVVCDGTWPCLMLALLQQQVTEA